MRVKMLVAISGGRADGRPWPGVGETIEVSDEEGAELTRTDPHHDYPMAVAVAGKRAEPETRAPEPAAETSTPVEEAVTERSEQPALNASHDAWVDYAVSKGAERREVESLTRTELIDVYGD